MRAVTGLTTALLLTALIVPALAQDDGYGYSFHENGEPGGMLPAIHGYAGLRGSLAFNGTSSTNIPTTPPTALRASYGVGGGASLFIGTHLPFGFKLELEGLYRNLPFSSLSLGGASTAAHGQAQIGAPIVNLTWDLPVGGFPIQPFIGGGIGGAYIAASLRDPTNTDTYYKANKWGFAYDAFGGAALSLSETSRFTAMYRWLRVDGINGACGTSGAATLTCSTHLDSQSVDLGLEMDL